MARGRHGDSAGDLLVHLRFAISIQLAADDRARPGAHTGPYYGTGLAAGFMTHCSAGRAADSTAHNGASPAVASSGCGCTDGSACGAANDGACLAAEFSSDGCASRASYTATYGRLRGIAGRGNHG
jgi:hypothetical protein